MTLYPAPPPHTFSPPCPSHQLLLPHQTAGDESKPRLVSIAVVQQNQWFVNSARWPETQQSAPGCQIGTPCPPVLDMIRRAAKWAVEWKRAIWETRSAASLAFGNYWILQFTSLCKTEAVSHPDTQRLNDSPPAWWEGSHGEATAAHSSSSWLSNVLHRG